MSHDPVTAPSHYTVYPVQPIAITRHLGFCLGNAVKYVLRAPFKNEAEDVRKAIQYLEWEIEAPAPLPTVKQYNAMWQGVDALIHHLLLGKRSGVKDLQSSFLIFLDQYATSGEVILLTELRECAQNLLKELEG